MRKLNFSFKSLLVAAGLLVGSANAWAVDVPDAVYFNDFSSNAGLTIVGGGQFANDDDAHFGRVFKNVNTNEARTNYLLLPNDVFSHSTTSLAMTISFWINAKNAGGASNYTYAPLLGAYGLSPEANQALYVSGSETDHRSGNNENWPVFCIGSRGVMELNCAGSWTAFPGSQNVDESKKNTIYSTSAWEASSDVYNHGANWLDDDKWHLFTVTITPTDVIMYLDGVVKNQWAFTAESGAESVKGFLTGGAGYLYNCLGGNEIWAYDDKDAAFMFDDFAVYDVALSAAQIGQIYYDKLNNAPIVTSVTANGADAAEKEYVKYEFNAWTNAHEYVGGGTGATYGGTSGQSDAKGWSTHTIGRQIKVTFNHALEAGDVITVNAACSYGGTDNRCPVGIATFAQGDIKTYKYLTLSFPTDGYTANTNYDLSYTVTENDSLCGKSELYIGGHNGTGGTVTFYFKSVKVTSNNSAAAYAPQTLSTAKTWTFEDLTTASRTEGAMMDGYLFIGADATHAVGVVEDNNTINNVAYTKALDFATTSSSNNITNGVNTNVAGCIMLKVPAGYGKIKVVCRNLGSSTDFYYNLGQVSRSKQGTVNSNTTTTKEIIYNVSESKPLILYHGKNYENSELYVYSVSWEPLSISTTITDAGYATFSSEYPLNLGGIEGGTAYIVKSDAVNGSSISLTAQAGQVAANTGLILKTTDGTAGTITIPAVLSGENISATNKLVAVTADNTDISENDYVLGCNDDYTNVGLYKLTASTTLDKGQAYLPASFSSVKALRFVIDDTATGIDSVSGAEAAEEDGVLYNTAGQVVSKDYKGIVIKNGKKYFNK